MTVGHVVVRVLAFLGPVVCLLVGSELWADAHVTYALPNGEGHDLLTDRRDAAIFAWILAVPALIGAVLVAWRSSRWAWLTVAAVALACVVAVIVGSSDTPDY